MCVLHMSPLQPAGHTQLNAATSSTHVPPFTHGDDRHSSMSEPQRSPPNPASQWHWYSPFPSSHAPWRQGALAQSSTLTSQFSPSQPLEHEQVYAPTPSSHLPSFWQGALAHSSTLWSHCAPSQPRLQVQCPSARHRPWRPQSGHWHSKPLNPSAHEHTIPRPSHASWSWAWAGPSSARTSAAEKHDPPCRQESSWHGLTSGVEPLVSVVGRALHAPPAHVAPLAQRTVVGYSHGSGAAAQPRPEKPSTHRHAPLMHTPCPQSRALPQCACTAKGSAASTIQGVVGITRGWGPPYMRMVPARLSSAPQLSRRLRAESHVAPRQHRAGQQSPGIRRRLFCHKRT